jgi:hypothetical protein
VTRRSTFLATLAAAALAGCPIPQPLPDYPEGQPVTPPRVVVNDTIGEHAVTYPDTIVRVPAGCDVEPVYRLKAFLRHADTIEPIIARWFVNYDPARQPAFTPQEEFEILAQDTSDPTLRDMPEWPFPPYQYASADGTTSDSRAAGALHVVELVVSNRFDETADASGAVLPYRTPTFGFETQVYRWVFLNVTPTGTLRCPDAAP